MDARRAEIESLEAQETRAKLMEEELTPQLEAARAHVARVQTSTATAEANVSVDCMFGGPSPSHNTTNQGNHLDRVGPASASRGTVRLGVGGRWCLPAYAGR